MEVKRFTRKCLLALLLSLYMAAAGAEPSFLHDVYTGFKGEKANIGVYQDGENAGCTLRVLLDDGREIGRLALTGAKRLRTAACVIPPDANAGAQISLWLDGADAPCDSALLAADARPGYAITSVESAQNVLAFTFDAANAMAYTREILDLLDRYGAKCTFFVIGRYAVNHPEICRDIVARGHEMGGHSFDHAEMRELPDDDILRDFSKTSAAFTRALGHDVRLYRPPSGYSTRRDRAIARALGYEVIKWSIDSRDGFKDSSLNAVVSRVRDNAGPGDIILMHVYGKHTIAALEILLPYYADMGYRFVTVSDLLLPGDALIDAQGVQRAAP